MNPDKLEHFLAQVYTNPEMRARFLQNPESTARAAGLDENVILQLTKIDREGIEFAGDSFERKRASQMRAAAPKSHWWRRAARALGWKMQ